jgi:hypothetical protein
MYQLVCKVNYQSIQLQLRSNHETDKLRLIFLVNLGFLYIARKFYGVKKICELAGQMNTWGLGKHQNA